MKLRSRIILNMMQILLIVIFVLSILFNTMFTESFNRYLQTVQQQRFDTLKDEISYLLTHRGFEAIPDELARYAGNESIEIEILNEGEQSLIKINELQAREGVEIARKSYNIIEDGRQIGTMILSYYSDSYYDVIAIDFRKKFTYSLYTAAIIALIAGLISSLFLTKSLQQSITDLSDTALAFRMKDYDRVPKPSTDIVEIEALNNSMIYLGNSLKDQEDIRKKYAQDISHELRTPLTNLQLHLEAIQDGILELDDQAINTLLEETCHLNKIVDQLKFSFHQDSETPSVHWEEFDLSEELIKMNRIISPSLKSKGIRLKSEIQQGIRIVSEREKLMQIMYNLLSNASRAITKDGLILVKLVEKTDQVQISVTDNGIGIAEEHQQKIFERFYRADSARTNRKEGSGLGLSIVKNLVQLLQGQIDLVSKTGQGSTFTITLPIKPKDSN